jgi:multidrug efflux pump subunit AcrB
MLSLLIFQLKSFARLFMVLSLVPLGLIGVVGALLVAGKPLGFVAILGILALVGMIAKNAVILIDQIEAERNAGKPVWDAVVEASVSRFRPIMLTALSTILGMIPIAPTVFWGSMAYAIMGGLAVASLLTMKGQCARERAHRREPEQPVTIRVGFSAAIFRDRTALQNSMESAWV